MKKRACIIAIIFLLLTIIGILKISEAGAKLKTEKSISNNISISDKSTANKSVIYLSDIAYESGSNVGWGSILYDKNYSDNLISVIVDNDAITFEKGVAAHATSTVIYNISKYDYKYFVTYAGVDSSNGNNGNGVKFYIYTSVDGTNWDLRTDENPEVLKGNSKAEYIKIDISNVNYLKLYANDNGSNGSDHAVYADAKLTNEDSESNNSIKTVKEYDEILKKNYNIDKMSSSYELTLLQREFINNVGYNTLQYFINSSDDNLETINWLMNSKENLSYYLIGGKPDGTYYRSLTTLTRLYKAYKNDLKDESKTTYASTKGDLYKRMMITLSLTHSSNVGLWAGGMTGNISDPNDSDAVVRYAIYKKMYLENKLDNNIFETLSVEEMRWVMNNIIDDESIEWLHDYSYNYNSNAKRNPYTYITYMFGYNYFKEEYYSAENYDKWNKKYGLSNYNITYKSGFPKLWIVFEENGVCGAIAKTGSNLNGVYGVPSTVVGQPGHAAYIYMSLNSNGEKIWNLYNDVSGWANSGRTEKLGVRMPNGWGEYNVATYNATIKPDTYVFLAQEALNDFDTYEEAEKVLMLANVYKDDNKKLEEIYRKALEIEPNNFDAWYGLVKLYESDTSKTEEEIYSLVEDIANTYTYHPLPMYDLLRILKPRLTSPEYNLKFTNLQTSKLKLASKATEKESIQYGGVKQIANALLGYVDTNVATFSFDGDNKETITLSDTYGDGVVWEYSLDGGINWIKTDKHSVKLSTEEIESITSENDIKVHIVGADYSEENIFTIDITKSSNPTDLYSNDLENKIMGVTNEMQWRIEGEENWTSFATSNPYFTGNKKVQVRVGATGTKLASDIVVYSFSEDEEIDTKKYVKISHLSIDSVSSEQTANNNYARYAIDGNANTIWHTYWNGSDNEKEIVIKLDNPIYLSALQYLPRKDSPNGRAKDAIIYVSMDGKNWTEAGSVSNWANNSSIKEIEFNESIPTKYVKFKVTQAYGGNYASAAIINLFEDSTKQELIIPDIEFSTTESTNNDVTATLVNDDNNITVTNNNGSNKYTFTENGEFTFEFVDKNGTIGSSVAKVTWIDKEAPIATVKYSITKPTNKEVVATITFNEEVNFSNDNITLQANEDGSYSYTFDSNDLVNLKFTDNVGNAGCTALNVTWIDTESPTADVIYDINTETTENVTVSLTNISENITVLNNNGKTNYTFTKNGSFEFIISDAAGNITYIPVKVDWIKEKTDDSKNDTIDNDDNLVEEKIISNNEESSNESNIIKSSKNNNYKNQITKDNNNENKVNDNKTNDDDSKDNNSNKKVDKYEKEENNFNFKYLFIILEILVITICIIIIKRKTKKESNS